MPFMAAGCLTPIFIMGKKAFNPQILQVSIMGQAQLTGILGPLVELVAMVKVIKVASVMGIAHNNL